jgi:hypothetical protein
MMDRFVKAYQNQQKTQSPKKALTKNSFVRALAPALLKTNLP